jgi:hypothetical protein
LAAVTVEDVWDALNVSDSDMSEAKVLKMIKRAEVTLELELNEEIDYENCSDAKKEAITVLAAMYALCYLTGGPTEAKISDDKNRVFSNACEKGTK